MQELIQEFYESITCESVVHVILEEKEINFQWHGSNFPV